MVDYREILRLHSLKYTQRQIAASVHSSRNTISEVIMLADKINLCWPLDDQLTNEKVYALLYPNKPEAVNPRKEPDYTQGTGETRCKSHFVVDRVLHGLLFFKAHPIHVHSVLR